MADYGKRLTLVKAIRLFEGSTRIPLGGGGCGGERFGIFQRAARGGFLNRPFLVHFLVVFSVSFLEGFRRLWGAILGAIFDDFLVFFPVKNAFQFSIDFSSILGWIWRSQIREN